MRVIFGREWKYQNELPGKMCGLSRRFSRRWPEYQAFFAILQLLLYFTIFSYYSWLTCAFLASEFSSWVTFVFQALRSSLSVFSFASCSSWSSLRCSIIFVFAFYFLRLLCSDSSCLFFYSSSKNSFSSKRSPLSSVPPSKASFFFRSFRT